MKKLIKHILENYEVDGTVFVQPQLAHYGFNGQFVKSWGVHVFLSADKVEAVTGEKTLYSATKAILAKLDALGLKKEINND